MQTKLDQKAVDELRCQWHSADHNKLSEITAGLLVSTNHLVEKVNVNMHILKKCVIRPSYVSKVTVDIRIVH